MTTTALTQLREVLRKIKDESDYRDKTQYNLCIATVNMFFEREKQQIIDAYWGGLNGAMNDYTGKKTKPGGGAELYYNETYAGKKKVKNNPK